MHLTIGIATWNRADLLAQTLASLGSLRVPEGVTWDVLVCDNNSTDRTRGVVEEAAAILTGCAIAETPLRPLRPALGERAGVRGQTSMEERTAQVVQNPLTLPSPPADQGRGTTKPGLTAIRRLFEPAQGKSHALNHLLREATGDWLLLLDDDVLVNEQWLCAYVDGIAQFPKSAVLGGAVLPRVIARPANADGSAGASPSPPLTTRQQFLLDTYPSAFGVLKFAVDTPITVNTLTPGGANMAVRLDVARQIGYDTKAGMFPGIRVAGEDATMALRIVERGHEGWMLAAARVLHWTPIETLNLRQIWRWQKGIGRSWVLHRGKPKPGKFGVAWWAWREMIRRYSRAMLRWRPWPDRRYCDAMIEAAQYWGYLTAK